MVVSECQCGQIGIFLFMVLVTIFLTKVAKYLATIGASYRNDYFKICCSYIWATFEQNWANF